MFTRADVERATRAGAHAVLVGEALMRAENAGAKVRELANVRLSANLRGSLESKIKIG